MAALWSPQGLIAIQVVAIVVLLLRFLATGLFRVYRVFFSYLLISLVQLAVPIVAAHRHTLYAYLYFATECAILGFYALIVLEMYTLVLRDLRGIASVARRYIKWALVAAVSASLVLLSQSRSVPDFREGFLLFDRSIVSSLVIFVLLITAFLGYYPIPLHRNVIWYSIGYACYFTGKAVGLFLEDSTQWSRFGEPIILFNSVLWLVFLSAMLTATGELKTLVIGHKWDPEHEQKLVRQLESINQTLLRARQQ